jgi:asparagine synthase (glutamine-hydrolysing)
MCGIFGRVSHDKALSPRDIEDCRAAMSGLIHRGPDAEGEWLDSHIYMGHRRLTIIDLSAAANQPFHDESGRYVLSYNGEIYNYLELRRELEQDGVRFRTESDTEVLLASWIRWGEAALTRFDGMFAAALHDRKTRQHYLFRDALGQKPLYYHADQSGVLYASELRSLLSRAGFTWRLDNEAFARYLMNGYYAWDETPILGIKKLLPGCLLRIEHGRAVRRRYWESIPGDDVAPIEEREAVAEFERLFDRSCEIAMRSDVPYGVFLSGGIDSSLVLNACHKSNPAVRSFSVAMGEADFDESDKARLMVSALGASEHNIFTMDQAAVTQAVDDVFANSDEPHGDPGFVNTLFLARACKPHVTVALAGDGGDEMFAGYAPFQGLAPVPWLRAMPSPLMHLFKHMAAALPQPDGYMSLAFKMKSYLQGFPAKDSLRYSLWLASLDLSQLARICPGLPGEFFSPDGAAGSILAPVAEMMRPVAGRSQQQMLLYYYQKLFLPEFVCMHTDRAAMQAGMEVRSPFLSVPLIEFANRLPDNMKARGPTLKWLPKRVAAKNNLPEEIYRQKKRGFTFPVARWLKGVLKDRMDDLLAPETLPERLVDPGMIMRYRDNHLRGRQNNYRLLYSLMAFQAWRRRYPGVEIS